MPIEHAVAERISDIFIDTSRAQQAFGRIDELMVRGWESTYCRALLLLGPARCGKTHIITEWARRRTEFDPEGKVLISEVPAPCSLRGLMTQLLDDLGDPDPDTGSPNSRTRRVASLGEDYDLIVIDEMQRLVDSETGRVKRDVAAWLTNLLNKRICPLLLVGESYASLVFEGVAYAEGRLLGQVLVEPYDWRDEREEFRVFLSQLEKQLGMPEMSSLASQSTALRMHSYSDGRIGQVARLVDEARAVARKAGRGFISTDDLAKAVDLVRIGEAQKLPNPFRMELVQPGGKPPPNVSDLPTPVRKGRGVRGVVQ